MTTPTVFISYSHTDEAWKDRLVTQLGVLQQEGLLDSWDDRRIEAGEDWKPKIEQALDAASVAVLLVSANFLTSQFILHEEVPRLLQRRAEQGVRIFPVIVRPCAWKQVGWLSRLKVYPKDGRPLSGGTDYQIDADLAAIAEEIANLVKRTAPADASAHFVPLAPDRVSLAKLPSTSSDLFGREKELVALDEAWDSGGVILSPAGTKNLGHDGEATRAGRGDHTCKVNILSLVAWGGVGKTALVNKWLSLMAADNYRGAERVFGWSFYSQGAAEGRQVSADQFIAATLKWFGDSQMAESAASPWDKGERLAELIRQSRTLLVLDGLEPLQNPPPVETGRLKDPALKTLLRELARHNPGLAIITTRLAADDLKDFRDGAVQQIDLEALSDEAGAAYLKDLGVKKATDEELKRASHEYKGHAFTLTLLGRYLADIYDGDIRKRDLIPRLTDEDEQGADARTMINAYERWFEGKPEQNILYVMGLFDRPAEKGALEVLKAPPVIVGLTDQIQGLSSAKWQFALKHLRQARLLAEKDPHDPDTLDCHPLLREHFGEQLRTNSLEAWREAHSRLYEYYKSSAKELPDTIEEMAPLFAAVTHGCEAGRHQEALEEVYWRRILRGGEHFSWKKLATFGSDLAAMSNFFESLWSQSIATLDESSKGFVFNQTGLYLRALGRLAEAAQPMQTGLDVAITKENWKNAAIGASNLSALYLTMGDLAQALKYAQQSVELADRSGDAHQRMSKRTTLADALRQAGRLSEAEAAFCEAEEIQKERQSEFRLLYSLWGFRYCDLLLSQGKYQEVQSRASQTLEWAEQARQDVLSAALDNVSLGRACLQEAQALTLHSPPSVTGGGRGGGVTQAAIYLQRAVDGLRQAGQQDDLPRGLLARAELYRFADAFTKAQNDLDEAYTIATRGGMRLYETDCHLEYARLYVAMNDMNEAQEHFVKARQMVEEIGYHRRDKDVQELEAMINGQ